MRELLGRGGYGGGKGHFFKCLLMTFRERR